MNTKSTQRLSTASATLAFLVLAPCAFSQTLLNLTFEGDTAGGAASGVTVINPTTPSNPTTPYGALSAGNVGTLVISSNDSPMNSGQALRLFDHNGSAQTGDLVRTTSSFSQSAQVIALSFDYRGGPSLVANNGNTFVRLAWGGSGVNASSSSSGNTGNFSRIQFSSNGNTSGFTAANIIADENQLNPNESVTNSVQLFINRGTTAFAYSGPGNTVGSIAANSYHVWFNGTQLTSGSSIAGGNFAMHNSTTDISHISFGTGGGQTGADWLIDNVNASVLSAIPEPSTYAALAGLGALGLAASRRRRSE